ncbi:DUF1010 domain-containing protein [Pulveribacter suum]|uniref:DUF1010 domain-containing protein n=1 Tax=Pulveribacter suum TaxID=2116657 RepID=UPI0038696552
MQKALKAIILVALHRFPGATLFPWAAPVFNQVWAPLLTFGSNCSSQPIAYAGG